MFYCKYPLLVDEHVYAEPAGGNRIHISDISNTKEEHSKQA